MNGLKYIALLFLAISVGCSSPKATQKAMEEAAAMRPDWVNSKPVLGAYFTGIGSAPKALGAPTEYQRKAKQNAMNDLASEISVKVSATSVLSQMESELGMRENFSATTRTTSDEMLEGFELVDVFETPSMYYIYYRLSKEKYYTLKEQRKNSAVSRAMSSLKLAEEYKSSGRYGQSIQSSAASLATLSPFLAEDLNVIRQNKSIDPASEAYRLLTEVARNIRISGSEEVTVKKGSNIPASHLVFQVATETGQPISGFPVRISYTGRGLYKEQLVSDTRGEVRIPLGKMSGTKSFEQLTLVPDMTELIRNATENLLLRKMSKKLQPAKHVLTIRLENPAISLSGNETHLGEKMAGEPLVSALKKSLIESGITLNESSGRSDYKIRVEASTQKGGVMNRMYTVVLNGKISVTDRNGATLYEKRLDQVKGVQLNYLDAGTDAYKKAARKVEYIVFREIKDVLFGK